MSKHILILLVCVLSLSGSAFAQRFILSYEDASSDLHWQVRQELLDSGFLDAIVSSLNDSIELPFDVAVVAGECDEVNAFWAPSISAIIMCYELVNFLHEIFRGVTSSSQELQNAVYGALEFIFYHELGHALISIYRIPFTGREEDAVDQFSTLILSGSDLGVEAALSGASFFYLMGEQYADELVFWGEHSLEQQRFYDIVCLVYGSNPSKYQHLVRQETKGFLLTNPSGYLPKQRADRCPSEYDSISHSWDTLIASYVTLRSSEAMTPEVQPTATPAPGIVTDPSLDIITGRLTTSDHRMADGEFFHAYPLSFQAGQEIVFDLRSNDFDTYLIVTSPSGETFANDDMSAEVTRSATYQSRLTLPISSSGIWTVYVTSYAANETGSYELSIQPQATLYGDVLSGSLSSSDRRFDTGEYYQSYSYDFDAGETVTLALKSADFDTYLFAIAPSGRDYVNDDYQGQINLSRLELVINEPGTWTVYVTSYTSGEMGDYQLAMARSEQANEASGSIPEALTTNTGRLEPGDELLEDGSYYDLYRLELQSGQTVVVTLVSADFNTYLALMTPSGNFIETDALSDSGRSRISLTAEESGEWFVIVTSEASGETGSYLLSVNR